MKSTNDSKMALQKLFYVRERKEILFKDKSLKKLYDKTRNNVIKDLSADYKFKIDEAGINGDKNQVYREESYKLGERINSYIPPVTHEIVPIINNVKLLQGRKGSLRYDEAILQLHPDMLFSTLKEIVEQISTLNTYLDFNYIDPITADKEQDETDINEQEDNDIPSKITTNQQMILLRVLGIPDMENIKNLPDTKKAKLFSSLLNRGEKRIKDRLTYTKDKSNKDYYAVYKENNIDIVNEILKDAGLEKLQIVK